MSQAPITFTSEEQLKLNELQQQAEGFANFRNAVARSLSIGQDSVVIANLLQFLGNMAQQSAQQIEQIKSDAQARSSADASKSAPTKSDKKKAS